MSRAADGPGRARTGAEVQLIDGGHWLLESHLDTVADYKGFLGRVL